MIELNEKKRKILEKKGIHTELDLAYVVPYKLYDFTKCKELEQNNIGRYVAISGKLLSLNKSNSNGRSVLKCKVQTITGILNVVYFGQAFMYNILQSLVQLEIVVCGKLEYSEQFQMYSMLNPLKIGKKAEILGWMKVYPKYTGIGENWLESSVKEVLGQKKMDETIPAYILDETKLPNRKDSLKFLHEPTDARLIKKGIQRQVFDDLLFFACSLERNALKYSKGSPYNLRSYKAVNQIKHSLPYKLTEDQEKVFSKLANQMEDGKRVNALIQGDVGCGKSIVAFLLMIAMADSGFQSVIMAPTLVLAEQHFQELSKYAELSNYKIAFIGGKQTAKEKREIKDGIANGSIQLVVGTQAVIGESYQYKNLALAVIDEEHRFGVKQREALAEKAKIGVHCVSFSATPIPRTIACSVYADTDVYEIKTMPKGRKPVQTAIVAKENPTIAFVNKELQKGNQAYVVCPLIEGITEKKSVEVVRKMYKDALGIEPGVVSGKQSKEETDKILSDFKAGIIKILIATTVIEVGVNVPNATVIVIEDAWMFGLAQLHQLRGRVGRGDKQGYCILRSDKDVERLQVMTKTTDGFIIAEEDMKLRGAGNIIGEEQSGKNRYLTEAYHYPMMFNKAREYAKKMVMNGEDTALMHEMEIRSDKIFVNADKIKIYV